MGGGAIGTLGETRQGHGRRREMMVRWARYGGEGLQGRRKRITFMYK